MKKIYYEKRGRRYVPVAENDYDMFEALPKGSHLVLCYPGGKSTRYNINPNYAAMIAAGRVAEDAMSEAIRDASEMRPKTRTLTPEQKAAWEHLIEVFGDDARMLQWPSTRDIAETAVKAMQAEADKLMKHASVKRAYEQFLLVCELTKENENV
jgi:hypothetical protein